MRNACEFLFGEELIQYSIQRQLGFEFQFLDHGLLPEKQVLIAGSGKPDLGRRPFAA